MFKIFFFKQARTAVFNILYYMNLLKNLQITILFKRRVKIICRQRNGNSISKFFEWVNSSEIRPVSNNSPRFCRVKYQINLQAIGYVDQKQVVLLQALG